MSRTRKNATVTESETVEDTRPAEIIELEKQLREAKERHKKTAVIDQARKDLEQYESQFDTAKEVFFKVNGARRVLKNAGLL